MKTMNNAFMAELSEKEMRESNGGAWFIPFILGGLAWDILSNPKESWEALKAGYQDGMK